MKELYRLCEDDSVTIVKNLKNLRPVQVKELKDLLSEVEKSTKVDLVQLFPSQSLGGAGNHRSDSYSPKAKSKPVIKED